METKYNLKIKDIWQLSESTDEFMDYVESRLLGKSKEPVFDSRVGEIPEDFLEEAFKQDKEGNFRHQLRNVVKKLLFGKLEFDAEDTATLEYVSRLVYLAEVIELESVFPVIFRFVLCPEYKNRAGIHTADIYVQFLRALAQLQPPMDLSGFWVKRFYDDDYIQYAQPLFTGLRRSSLEHTGSALSRLISIADNYPEFLDKNRALRPLIKVCQDTKSAQLLAKGFSSLPAIEQKKVMDAICNLDPDLIQPLETVLKSYNS
jgi:hypothetical protein